MTTAPTPDLTGDAPALTVRSTPIQDPGVELIDLMADSAGFAWSRNGEGLVGWGVAAAVRTDGPERFTSANLWWQQVVERAVVRDAVEVRGSGLTAFGSFAFAGDSTAASRGGTGSSLLAVPQFVVGHRGDQWWVTTVGAGDAGAGRFPPMAPDLVVTDAPDPGRLTIGAGGRTPAAWQQSVATAVDRISRGELDKVVLARDLAARAEQPIDARWVARRLARRYPTCFTYSVDGLIGATPELLIRLDGRLATSRVLAGTIRRTGSQARDEALAGSLSRSSKDLEEHEYAVASAAEVLAPHCTGMNVPESPFVLHLPNVMHLATDITGVVREGPTALDLAAALHPTAAVCGSPRAAAAALIRELEGLDRARFAGPTGWLGADGSGEFGIALRCGELDPVDPTRMRLFAGCGIVADSDPSAELAETEAKLLPMRQALTSSN